VAQFDRNTKSCSPQTTTKNGCLGVAQFDRNSGSVCSGICKQDEQLNIKVKRVASIKGIGQVTSVALWFIQEALRRLKMEIN